MKWLRRLFGKRRMEKEPSAPEMTEPPAAAAPASGVPAEAAPPSPEPSGGTMPLPPMPPRSAVGLRFGWATDPGLIRARNEDALLILHTVYEGSGSLLPVGLFLVADGMGGHRGGEQASDLAVREIARYLASHLFLPHLARRVPDHPIKELLEEAVRVANAQILQAVPGGGTTVVGALIIGDSVHLIHVGDSRAYLVWPDRLEQLTEDHSLVQRMISLQGIRAEEAAGIPRNLLYQALGHPSRLSPGYRRIALPPDAWLMLCTDGLWGEVPEDRILQTVWESASPQEACDRLVQQARAAGGHDNISVILVGR
ncbi:PP2C family protein-serine/threonine phosphatase [Thermoflexus hugenholtzii]|uniref:Serine/threonine protein phosphatase PrpC n=1 Tax=Thermoflexus hugenholtzii JAD2 TaxID=877466 RepID=A0A212QWC6_9CHLR|nr:protein phosphatase 2C domain-containing protein [Thermoflexus hugenholtzii]SNB63923.1 Serine/threonine protein phosphatase PrpC [Thermoflexus hugenholtzii JAD2]